MATKKNTTLEETDAKKGGAATKSPFSAKFLKQQREMLISERATYERQAAKATPLRLSGNATWPSRPRRALRSRRSTPR